MSHRWGLLHARKQTPPTTVGWGNKWAQKWSRGSEHRTASPDPSPSSHRRLNLPQRKLSVVGLVLGWERSWVLSGPGVRVHGDIWTLEGLRSPAASLPQGLPFLLLLLKSAASSFAQICLPFVLCFFLPLNLFPPCCLWMVSFLFF